MRVLRVAHHGVVPAWRERERRLAAEGVDVTLLSARRWNEGGADLDLAADGDTFVEGAGTLGTHPNVFAYDPRPLWRLLGRSWDVIDLHEEPCSLAVAEIRLLAALRRQRAPYLLYSAQNIPKRYPPPFRWFERSALRHAAGAYVCNAEAGRILAAKGLRGPAELIGLGVDTDRLGPVERDAPDPDRLVLGYAGRLEPHKGVAILLDVLAKRPGWTLRVAGDGPQRAALAARASALGVEERVTFLGHVSGDALAGHYRRCDVTVVPSLPTPGWLEQFGRVVVESMACGTPVVANRSGALPDVVADAGLLVEPADLDELLAALDEVAEPQLWREHRARGLEHATRYGWDAVAAQHLALYRRVLGLTGGTRGLGVDGAGLPPVHVLVVAYGDPAMLDDCLAALGGALPVLVVDNSSAAAVAEVAARHGAAYLDPGANLGFGAGVNVGVRALHATGERPDLLLLNPDARMDAKAVAAMQEVAHRGRVAAVGVSQVDPATGRPARVLWPFPSPVGAWVEAFGLGRLRRREDFAIGSMLLLRADAWDDVGPMDERFFLYAEETDWQKRARERGWTIAVADAETSHVGAGTGGDPARREAWFHASLEAFVRKHHGRRGWRVFRAGMVTGAAVRGWVLPGERGAAARRRRDLYLAGPATVGERPR
ncbi:glycosyltransferase [Mumia sp. DW29H23]|uniref:glycosyltransferase n=1 Tax=Mumia sp. DW29H23 TaxID=3421241 RepID=UPI003D681120